jgi:hypothetical protein
MNQNDATARNTLVILNRLEQLEALISPKPPGRVFVLTIESQSPLSQAEHSGKTRPGHPAGEEIKSYGVAKQTRCPDEKHRRWCCGG